MLLALEAGIRAQATVLELRHHLFNESRQLLGASQAVLLDSEDGQPRVRGISSLPDVDRQQPVVRGYEALARVCLSRPEAAQGLRLDRAEFGAEAPDLAAELPYQYALWLPVCEEQQPARGQLLLFSHTPWSDAQVRIGRRLMATYAHAWRTLSGPVRSRRRWLRERRTQWAIAAALVLAAAYPVALSALAPVEVSAREPFVVAAPMAGVVAEMLVSPNVRVAEGQAILRYEDTRLRNELQLSERRLQVATARLAGLTQAAIDSAEASREVAINRAERDLAQAEYDYARALLEQAVVRAPRAGVAVYTDPRDWQGRPVETGQQILRIADPARIEFTILLPVQDSLLVEPGADVRVYLDSDPLHPIAATVERASYQAARTELGSFAYRLTAQGGALPAALRIGMRGTAQVYGRRVPLIYALLRRPISSLRQSLGW